MSEQTPLLAGVDEAGRGPLAGPVVAAVVVLRQDQQIPGVRDSKKLSAARRAELSVLIRREAVAWALASASPQEIDQLNILQATLLAMRRAVEQLPQGLSREVSVLHVDGNRCPELPPPYAAVAKTLVGGDDLCLATAAASILAKVSRDEYMLELHRRYPQYGFDHHKGYPTVAHRQALIEWGATPEHRTSFRPVREAATAIGRRGMQ